MESTIRKSAMSESPEVAKGLTTAEALARRQHYGANTLPTENAFSAWSIMLNQFKSPLISSRGGDRQSDQQPELIQRGAS
jgi:magnesium-transporting ATPase (P-type)